MTNLFLPERLHANGFSDIISIIPPGAQLTPSSKIQPNQLGKIPGVRLGSGLWAGYDWRRARHAIEDANTFALWGANVGLRADRFPGVDIDTTDARLAQVIEEAAIARLGEAPRRVGKAPKTLLMYRTDAPFGRMRLWITRGEQHHLVEVLGQGQQYVVHGTHPTTGRAYTWSTDLAALTPESLTPITREQAAAFLDYVAELLSVIGPYSFKREGDGRAETRQAKAQHALLSPDLDTLREAVSAIPNTDALFPDRTSYLRMGYAIRAAAGTSIEDGLGIFAEWAARWPGNERTPHGNDPDVVVEDWRRFTPPYSVGWQWIAEQARQFGFNDAALEFDVVEAPRVPADEGPVLAPLYSDQWLADEVVQHARSELRFAPERGLWYVWSGPRWEPDAELLADDIIKRRLRVIANDVGARGSTDKEKREFGELAVRIASAGKVSAVRTLVQSDRSIAVAMAALDHNPWLLNTPAGLVDLKTGVLRASDRDALATKQTAVPADFGATPKEWLRFLQEATQGDAELIGYLQRLAGYALTGVTSEQHVTFVWGPGGNGKSVFANVLLGILNDYARTAPMDTFTASASERHSTDIAGLVGARLVVASETQAGRRWDEQRVKSLSGGEPVAARFMRQDFFTFIPTFKLLFLGNHRPEIRSVDEAMRRRIHLVPFTVKPTVVDRELANKLRTEWPAILAWMIAGCLAWQQQGLAAPETVREATEEYFDEEDALGRWMADRLEIVDTTTTTQVLFDDWTEWAHRHNEYVGTAKRLASALASRGVARWRDGKTRLRGFRGVALKNRQDGAFGE